MKGHLRQRGERWYAVIDVGRTPSGRRHQRWINLGTNSKRAAERALAKVLTQSAEGTLAEPNRATVTELLGQYIESRRVAGRAPATLLNYSHLAGRIKKRIGHIRLSDLKPGHLEALYAAELADWDARFEAGKKHLSPRTVRHEHDLLRTALKYAVRQGLVVRNPADMVTPPRAPQLEQRVLTPGQVAQLLDTLRPHRLYALIYLAVSTGMRRGELIGLRWGDVDLEARRLEVRVQRQYRPGEGVQERETKEHRGVRAIELTEAEVAVLREHRKRQDLERRDLREAWEDPRLVFASELGTPLNPRNVQRFLDLALKKAGLPDVRFHDLRHTAGTLLMRHDGRVVAAQHRLGHARPSTTLNLYGHALPGDQRQATEHMLEAIERERRRNASPTER